MAGHERPGHSASVPSVVRAGDPGHRASVPSVVRVQSAYCVQLTSFFYLAHRMGLPTFKAGLPQLKGEERTLLVTARGVLAR